MNKNEDKYDQELNQVRNTVHSIRENFFNENERPMGHKHWTEKNLELAN